jgi:glycosyltransferase involved in cell wall biosynthesis
MVPALVEGDFTWSHRLSSLTDFWMGRRRGAAPPRVPLRGPPLAQLLQFASVGRQLCGGRGYDTPGDPTDRHDMLPSLRILHVTPYSADAWAYGGIPRLAGTLTRELAHEGHDVTVCTTDACDADARLPEAAARGRLRPWPPVRATNGVTVRVFPNVSNRLAYRCQLFAPLGLHEYLREHACDFDVAHLHACRNLPGVVAAYHLGRAGVPYVLAPNGTAPRIERRRIAKGVFDLVVGRRILRDATRVLAVSTAERQQLQALGVNPERIRLVPNPVDLDEFDPPVEAGRFRQRLAIGTGRLVLFLGKLTPRKRVDVLARAFTSLASDARLVIAGNDMGAERATRSLVDALGLGNRTRFTGLLRGRERLEALADADVVVYPSQDEIFGLVPLEALLAGSPVVVADDSGCGEIVRAMGGGQVVRLGDIEALARAMDDVLDAATWWRARAARAAENVRRVFAPRVVCTQLSGVYQEMVARA